jgi:tetratricopeptide (TPR) repeat protein
MSLFLKYQSAPFANLLPACNSSWRKDKMPRAASSQLQPSVVLVRTQRSFNISRRVVPLFLTLKTKSAQAPANPFQSRACHVIQLLMVLLLIASISGTFRAVAADVAVTNEPAAGTVATPTNEASSADIKSIPQPAADTASTNTLTNTTTLASTNTDSAPEPGQLPVPSGLNTSDAATTNVNQLQQFQILLDLGRQQRRDKDLALAAKTLVSILESNAPTELKRPALFELALVSQDDGKFLKAQQIFAQYMHIYPNDPSVPEVLLRQGLIYRQMGVNALAVSKFYAVMSTALKLKLDNMEYYKKLVLQAQIEIADTYYLEGEFEESADFFTRLLKSGAPELNKPQIEFKRIRSLSFLTNQTDTIAKAQTFLELYTNSSDVPEVRFMLASSLKKIGRNREAMKQVLLLLQSQQENVRKNPETWIYWQQKAGNDIANQLYKEGDYIDALQIYLGLADLDHSPAWQMPVWYQSGLVYEQLQQPPKAAEMYQRIMDRQKELTEGNSSPSLQSLIDMAKWRKDYLDWMQKAKTTTQAYQPGVTNSLSPMAAK